MTDDTSCDHGNASSASDDDGTVSDEEEKDVRNASVDDGLDTNKGGDAGRCDSSGNGVKGHGDKYGGVDSDVLYARLKEVDIDMAKKIHPRNRRKVVRYTCFVCV